MQPTLGRAQTEPAGVSVSVSQATALVYGRQGQPSGGRRGSTSGRRASVRDLVDGATMHGRPDQQIDALLDTDAHMVDDMQSTCMEDITRKITENSLDDTGYNGRLEEMRQREEELVREQEDRDPEIERQHSHKRIQKFSALVSEQQRVHDRILTRVKIGAKEDNEGLLSPGATECFSPSEHASPNSSYRPVSAPGGCWPTREVNACIVADKLEQQQARNERFQEGKQAAFEKQLKSHEDIRANHDADDLRHEKRLKDRLWQQQEKIKGSQQKHSDHEKILREVQKSQDQEWKLLQAKVHDSPKKQVTRPNSSPAKKSVPSRQKEKDPFTSHMLQSHAEHMGTFAQFQLYVAESDRRTEAHWKKVAPDEWRARRQREQGSKGAKVVRRAVKVMTMASRITRANSMRRGEPMVSQCDNPGEQVAKSSPDLSRAITPDEAGSPLSVYEMRQMRCKEVQEELEAARREKHARDVAKLEAHSERRKNELLKRVESTGSMVEAWQSRSSEAAIRRDNQYLSDGSAFFRKHEKVAADLAEFKEQQQEALEGRMGEAALCNASVRSAGKYLQQQTEREQRTRQAEKASTAVKKSETKFTGWSFRTTNSKHETECQAVLERKQGFDDEFRKQASAEIEHKILRNTQALSLVKKPPTPMEALEKRRPQSSSRLEIQRRKPSELNLPSEMMPPSGLFALSPSSEQRFTPLPSTAPAGAAALAEGSSGSPKAAAPPKPANRSPFIMRQSLLVTKCGESRTPVHKRLGLPASAFEDPLAGDATEVGRDQSKQSIAGTGVESMAASESVTQADLPRPRTLSVASGRSGSKSAVPSFDAASPSAWSQASPCARDASVARRISEERNQLVSPQNAADDVDSESAGSVGEDDFLQDLQARSSKWIHEARMSMR